MGDYRLPPVLRYAIIDYYLHRVRQAVHVREVSDSVSECCILSLCVNQIQLASRSPLSCFGARSSCCEALLKRAMSRGRVSLSPLLLLVLFAFVAHGSVHEYAVESFTSKGNAFVIHGGSEGIYSSSASNPDERSAAPSDREAYIK